MKNENFNNVEDTLKTFFEGDNHEPSSRVKHNLDNYFNAKHDEKVRLSVLSIELPVNLKSIFGIKPIMAICATGLIMSFFYTEISNTNAGFKSNSTLLVDSNVATDDSLLVDTTFYR